MVFQAPPPQAGRNADGAAYAYYLTWHAQGSAESQIQPASFSIRSAGTGGEVQPCSALAAGVVWDIENIETGWQSWPAGGNKEYRPNPALSTPLPFPGNGFRECVKIPIALDHDTVACWDQASTGTWKSFCQIAAVIAQQAPQNPGLYPLIKFSGSTLTQTGRNSTQVPNFEIIRWVEQPPCLAPETQQPVAPPPAGFTQPAAAPAQQLPGAPPAAPIPVPVPTAPAPAPATPAAPKGAWNT